MEGLDGVDQRRRDGGENHRRAGRGVARRRHRRGRRDRRSQVDFLYDADADQVQGFYFGKPVPASEISADVLKDFRQDG